MIFSYRRPVIHGVECRDLVHAHRWELKQFRDVVHDADAGPSLVLFLSKIEQWNDRRLFILRRVVGYNSLGFLEVFRSKLKMKLAGKIQDVLNLISGHWRTLGLLCGVSRC